MKKVERCIHSICMSKPALIPKTGAPTWTDVNGDGKFDPNVDRKIVGTANPKFLRGLYKYFEF